jgi:hypothetical protein
LQTAAIEGGAVGPQAHQHPVTVHGASDQDAAIGQERDAAGPLLVAEVRKDNAIVETKGLIDLAGMRQAMDGEVAMAWVGASAQRQDLAAGLEREVCEVVTREGKTAGAIESGVGRSIRPKPGQVTRARMALSGHHDPAGGRQSHGERFLIAVG